MDPASDPDPRKLLDSKPDLNPGFGQSLFLRSKYKYGQKMYTVLYVQLQNS